MARLWKKKKRRRGGGKEPERCGGIDALFLFVESEVRTFFNGRLSSPRSSSELFGTPITANAERENGTRGARTCMK